MRDGRTSNGSVSWMMIFRRACVLAECVFACLALSPSRAAVPFEQPLNLVEFAPGLRQVAVPGDGSALPSAEPRPNRPSSAPAPSVRPPLPPGHPSIEAGGLDDLFQKLHDAPSEDDAKPIDALIQSRMMRSGSATVDLLMDRALVAVQADNKALAFDILDSVIALKPEYAEGWNKRATLYFLSHDYGKAISDVEMVLRLQPRHYRALIGLAGMLNELGDKTHALAALKRVLAIYPTNAEVAKDIMDLETAIGGQSL